jgi:hypothetical protein
VNRLRFFAVVCASIVASLILAGTAAAAPFAFKESFGSFTTPESVAVDPGSHDVYVLDREAGTVERFDSSGAPAPFSASESYINSNRLTGTSEGPFGFAFGQHESQIAVAPPGAAGGTAGDIYVTDTNNTAIDIFDSTGTFLGRLDSGAVPGGFSLICGVAVDSAGAVYVGDFNNNAIDRFVPASNPATDASYDSQLTGVGGICNLAAGSSTLYAITWSTGPLTAYPISVFPGGGGSFDASSSGSVIEDEGSPALASAAYVDALSDELFVDEESQAAVFDSSGSLLEHFGGDQGFESSIGIASDSDLESAYVADIAAGRVDIFGPPVPAAPTVSNTSFSLVTPTEARLEAKINPRGSETSIHFEYVDDAHFQAEEFAGATLAPVPDRHLAEGFSDHAVAETVDGLLPETTYHFRVMATNSLGPTFGPERTFNTPPLPVQQSCPNAALRTGLSAALPNCRAYELVTPIEKDYGYGGLPGQPIPQVAVGSVSGDAAIYDSGGPQPGATSGAFIGYYKATRGSAGWASRSISALQAPIAGLGGVNPAFYAFSPDLSRAISSTVNPPLTPDALPNIESLYAQDVDASSWRLLTPKGSRLSMVFGGASSDYSLAYYESNTPQVEEAPEEFGVTNSQVYGVSNDAIYLAGILPDGTIAEDAILPGGSSPSTSFAHPSHIVSTDGTRVAFYHHVSSGGGTPLQLYLRINAPQPQSPLGLQDECLDPSRACTFWVSQSQKTNGAGPGGIDPNPLASAAYQEADSTATKFLFSSRNELTNDANTGRNGLDESTDAGNDLYVYDTTSGQLVDLTVDTNPADSATGANVLGILGTSPDLSYVYFVGTGNLDGEATSGGPNLYLWHEGQTKFIATLDPVRDSGDWTTVGPDLTARVTPDGLHAAFTSAADITGFDNKDATTNAPDSEVFLYSATTGELVCASCNPSGANPSGSAGIRVGSRSAFNQPHNLSDDGSRLFFNRADSLVPRDTNGRTDVYLYEDGRIFLISSGTGETAASFGDASPSGNDVFFGTEEKLLPQDHDVLPDLYDARVNGGFVGAAAEAAPCSDESCRPSAQPAPSAAEPGSSTFSGPGNLKHQRRHRHHHRKNHHRKKHQARHHRVHRHGARIQGAVK